MVVVYVAELDWIEADGDYVRLYAKGKYHLMRERISSIEQQLNPAEFVRIHRSVIARIDRIKELKPLINGDHRVILHDGTQLSLSRTYRDKALAVLAQT
jgi:two-component system LytT family response regulator